MTILTYLNRVSRGGVGRFLNTPGITASLKKAAPKKGGGKDKSKGFIDSFVKEFKTLNVSGHVNDRIHSWGLRQQNNLLLDTEIESLQRGKDLCRMSAELRAKEQQLAGMVYCWPGYEDLHSEVIAMRREMRKRFD
jgi:hypothetical protein